MYFTIYSTSQFLLVNLSTVREFVLISNSIFLRSLPLSFLYKFSCIFQTCLKLISFCKTIFAVVYQVTKLFPTLSVKSRENLGSRNPKSVEFRQFMGKIGRISGWKPISGWNTVMQPEKDLFHPEIRPSSPINHKSTLIIFRA